MLDIYMYVYVCVRVIQCIAVYTISHDRHTFINGCAGHIVEHERCVNIGDEAKNLKEITVLLERDHL